MAKQKRMNQAIQMFPIWLGAAALTVGVVTAPAEIESIKHEHKTAICSSKPYAGSISDIDTMLHKSTEVDPVKEVIQATYVVGTPIEEEIVEPEPEPTPAEIYNVVTPAPAPGVLNADNGRVTGPSGVETFYNLDMSYCVQRMKNEGYDYEYWVRDDGVKMFGPYVMCATNFNVRPRGTILETSLGTAISVDTGDFAQVDPTGIDICTTW